MGGTDYTVKEAKTGKIILDKVSYSEYIEWKKDKKFTITKQTSSDTKYMTHYYIYVKLS